MSDEKFFTVKLNIMEAEALIGAAKCYTDYIQDYRDANDLPETLEGSMDLVLGDIAGGRQKLLDALGRPF